MTSSKTIPGLWVGQTLHFSCLSFLLAIVWLSWIYLDRPFALVFWIAISIPILHQVFVWLAWRLELQSSTTSNAIGFHGYVVYFFLLFSARFVSLFVLAWLDSGSLKLHIVPLSIVTTILTLTGLYAIYSVKRYFGMVRASGADHFEQRYRQLPMVKEGIFRFTNNGMYIYAFLLFWAIAIGFNSKAAVIVAAFSHAYIWIHFYATEKPDMEYLYNSS